MGGERLCPDCLKKRGCWFKGRVNEIVDKVNKGKTTPEKAQKEIAELRDPARNKGCPHVNYDPPYQGRERL